LDGGFLVRQLTRGAKIFNGVLALPLIGLGVLSMFYGAWQGALACFALALFLFWILPTLMGNLKAALQEKVKAVASTHLGSKESPHSVKSGSEAVDDDSAI
jgi:hypothetical protein